MIHGFFPGEPQCCRACGKERDVFYHVHFYLLPHRLRRKRHRDQGRHAFYCRECYEDNAELTVSFSGTIVGLSKARPQAQVLKGCAKCGTAFKPPIGLHGLLVADLWMGGSCVESSPLAMFCSKCVDACRLELPAQP
jgi:hypothetical protein